MSSCSWVHGGADGPLGVGAALVADDDADGVGAAWGVDSQPATRAAPPPSAASRSTSRLVSDPGAPRPSMVHPSSPEQVCGMMIE